jgi:hypothetical protein
MTISNATLFWPQRQMRSSTQSHFQMQHHMRHIAYEAALGKTGLSLGGQDLTGPVTQDWLMRHAVRHSTLRKIIGSSGQSPTVGLSSLDFGDEQAVRAWQQYHALLHGDLDQYFGIH